MNARPHSRACGVRPHAHGWQCHSNCPTCAGRDDPRVPMKPRVRKGKHGVGWVASWGSENWVWHATWHGAMRSANLVAAQMADRQRWTGGA